MSENNETKQDDITMPNETKEKSKKKIPVVRLILLGLFIYVMIRYVIGDGRDYDYVKDTAIYGMQNGSPVYGQNVLLAEDGSKYAVYYSNRHTETYNGNLASKEYIKQTDYIRSVEIFDINVIGNTVYALEGGVRIISFDLTNPEEVTILRGFDNDAGEYVNLTGDSDKNIETHAMESLLVVDDTCYFICKGEDNVSREDDRFVSFNLTTGEEKVIETPTFEEYFIDNDTVYFLNRDDGFKLYSMPLEGGEATKLTPFRTSYPVLVDGRIYYAGNVLGGMQVLMSMNPDGTDHKMHKFVDAGYYGTSAVSDGILYSYEDGVITSIDLTDGKFTESEINVEEQAVSKLAAYYAEEIETTTGEENGFGTDGAPFTVANGYAFFETVYTFGETKFDEAFICDLETGEVYLLNEYFGIGPEIEYKEVFK